MPYIGKTTDGFGVRNRFVYLASSGDTSVSGADANGATLTFTDGAYVDVYLNGVLLKPTTDYNTSTANTIAGLSALNTNDEVTVVVYDVFTVADMVSATSGGTFSGAVTANSTLDMNGTELILDADGDTSITADTDDQIDFRAGGTDRMSIKSTGQIFIGNTSGTLPSGTMGVNSAGRHIIANDGAGFLLLQDNSTAAQNNGFDIHMGGVSAGNATYFSGGSIGGFVENSTNADGYLKFSTSLNGTITEAMRINSDGKVTMPKQPVFMAKFLGFQSGASATNPASNYQSPAINVGSHFDSSTGVFTAPVAGTYIFFGSLLSTNNSVVVRIYFEKNGSIDMGTQHEARTTEGYSGYKKQNNHAIITLAANDTVELVVYQDSTNTFYATNDSSYNSFSGYLIG